MCKETIKNCKTCQIFVGKPTVIWYESLTHCHEHFSVCLRNILLFIFVTKWGVKGTSFTSLLFKDRNSSMPLLIQSRPSVVLLTAVMKSTSA